MANSKISALTSATTPLAGTETLPIVQSGVTKKVAVADLTAGRSVATGNLTTTGTMAFTVNTADASGLTGTNSNNSAYFTLMVGGSSGFGISNWANSTILESVPASTGGLVLGSYTGKTYFQIGRYSYMDLSSSALTFTAINLVQGTAAKGVNFTANTPAAGMTSQLLNWYEEGTWTPNQGSGLTVIGAFSSVGRYTRTGNVVVVNFSFTGATSVEVNAGGNLCTNLPYTVNANVSCSGVMSRGGLASGGTCAVEANTTNAWAASTIAATGTLFCSVTYIV